LCTTVRRSFKAGSFGFDLVATQHLLSQIKEIFSGNGASAVSNGYTIMTMVGFIGGGGLIGLLRRLKGRRPVRIQQEGKVATVHVSQTELIEVDFRVLKLFHSSIVRSSLEKVVSPLEQDGITDFGIVMHDKVALEVHDDEVGSLSAVTTNTAEEVVSDTTSHKMLQSESLTFKGNKWRVHDGIATFYVSVEDKEFLKKIDAGERFGKGDVLLVDLREVQSFDRGRLNNESTIVKVLEHREPLQQDLQVGSCAGAGDEHPESSEALAVA
jgi:hypothetical protein